MQCRLKRSVSLHCIFVCKGRKKSTKINIDGVHAEISEERKKEEPRADVAIRKKRRSLTKTDRRSITNKKETFVAAYNNTREQVKKNRPEAVRRCMKTMLDVAFWSYRNSDSHQKKEKMEQGLHLPMQML